MNEPQVGAVVEEAIPTHSEAGPPFHVRWHRCPTGWADQPHPPGCSDYDSPYLHVGWELLVRECGPLTVIHDPGHGLDEFHPDTTWNPER